MSGAQTCGDAATVALPERVPADLIAAWLASELAALAGDLEQFQHDLSDLLSEEHVSSQLMRRLQTLDGATQALAALARVALALQEIALVPTLGVAAEELADLVRLGDLRQRLLGADPAPSDAGMHGKGHVNFF